MSRIPLTITIDSELFYKVKTGKGQTSERVNDLIQKGLLYEAEQSGMSDKDRMNSTIKYLIDYYNRILKNTLDKSII